MLGYVYTLVLYQLQCCPRWVDVPSLDHLQRRGRSGVVKPSLQQCSGKSFSTTRFLKCSQRQQYNLQGLCGVVMPFFKLDVLETYLWWSIVTPKEGCASLERYYRDRLSLDRRALSTCSEGSSLLENNRV